MGVVVERGLARCPRCVAVADYAFIELGPDSLAYEVDCRRCGERYREVHGPAAPTFGVVAVADWVPDGPSHTANRERLLAWLAVAQSRGRASRFSGVTASLSAWTHAWPAEVRAGLKGWRSSEVGRRNAEPNALAQSPTSPVASSTSRS